MSSNDQNNVTVTDLRAALIQNDKGDLVDYVKNKLQDLSVKLPNVLDKLSPAVRNRVEDLKNVQAQYDDLEAKFLEERASLEDKYQKLYQPFYVKRYGIVSGNVEVEEGVTNEGDATSVLTAAVKGVPDFWLIAMKNNVILAEEITKRDEGPLKFLLDVKWSKVENHKGFRLDFYFDTNPFLKNPVLTKTYHMIDENEPILDKAIGTEIEWYPGKCVTHKILKIKPKKGSQNTSTITKTKPCKSFFNFFSPPRVPGEDEDIDEDEAEELENMYGQDYEIGSTIRDTLIPHAVSWFTGEAGEDEIEDLTDDDDEEGEEDEDLKKPSTIHRRKKGGMAPG